MTGEVIKKFASNSIEETLCIEVTTYCNSFCLHCFVQARAAERSNMPPAVAKEIIHEGHAIGYRQLHITGGEPLLWEGLGDTLDYAFEMGYEKVSLNTNGTILTEEVAKNLAIYDGLSISISLDGPEPLHDYLRGKGSHQKALLGIAKTLDAGIDLVIFTVARTSLITYLPHFVDDLYKKFSGIKYLTLIQLISTTDDDFSFSRELLKPADFLKLVKTIALLNLYGLKTNLKNNLLANIASKLLGIPWIPKAHRLCCQGSLVVMANGDIALSHSSRDIFGKYAPGMIQKVLSSNKYRSAVMSEQLVCCECSYADLCKKNGLVGPLEHHRDMHPAGPYCRRVLDSVTQ